MKKLTREWVRKAEADHRAAINLATSLARSHDQVCFFCQQSAEKYLKALLEELGQIVPKTHDLVRLLNLLFPTHRSLRKHRRVMGTLTDFAVAARYPGKNTSKRQATAALGWVGNIRHDCRAILGLRTPKRKSP